MTTTDTEPVTLEPITRRNYGRGHGYHDSTGAKIRGVTTWINDGMPKPALVNWAANEAAGYAVDHWTELDELSVAQRLDTIRKQWRGSNKGSMAIGTRVHAIAEQVVTGAEVHVDDDIRGYVEQYVAFLDAFDVQPVVVEGVVGNLTMTPPYAGTLDLIADLKDGQRWLLDLKTGASVWGEVGLQLAAYRYATTLMVDGQPEPMPEVDACGVVHVRPDTYELRPVKADADTFLRFRYVQQVALTGQQTRNWLGEAMQP